MKIRHNQSISGEGVIFSGSMRVRVEEGFRFYSSHRTIKKRNRLNSRMREATEFGEMNSPFVYT